MADGIQMTIPSAEGTGKHAKHKKHVRTPTLISPPDTKTPPTASHKRHQGDFAEDRNSEPVDASILIHALDEHLAAVEHFQLPGQVRERTPTASPSRKRQRIYGDR